MNIYDGIVSNSLLKKFSSGYPANVPLTNFVANFVDLEGVLPVLVYFAQHLLK
ncbi:hypothetical protein [Proteus mirabilis]|uniref:hypothetical protein n=1 Tax=Proteus mirabilis TaxID=584 RepID=UPI0034E53674